MTFENLKNYASPCSINHLNLFRYKILHLHDLEEVFNATAFPFFHSLIFFYLFQSQKCRVHRLQYVASSSTSCNLIDKSFNLTLKKGIGWNGILFFIKSHRFAYFTHEHLTRFTCNCCKTAGPVLFGSGSLDPRSTGPAVLAVSAARASKFFCRQNWD